MNILVDGQTLETPEVNRGIGVYFKNVLNSMIKQSYEHNWYITLSDKSAVKNLDSWVSNRITVITSEKFTSGSDFQRTDAYTAELQKVVEQYNIDMIWLPNPMMVNVLFPNKSFDCPIFTTMYDLIPQVMPVKEWSNEVREEYSRRLQFIKNEKIRLLCISESTKRDFIKYVGEVPYMEVTFLGADSKLFYRPRKKGGLSNTPNIVFTGGFDYRKNLSGAIEILKRAKDKYKNSVLDNLMLYLICSCDETTKALFTTRLKEMGLEKNVCLTGFVSNYELADYYANADVFFFPSLYEGFGLPILEAMLGGAYVLSADNSSLPEICGNYALLGNVEDTDKMADLLYQSLENTRKESLEDKLERQNYAYNFSWEETAKKTLKIFESVSYSELEIEEKKKIALVTPWPNQRSGIANYVFSLLPYLSKYYSIDIFADFSSEKGCVLLDNNYGEVFEVKELDERHGIYREIIYHIGNNSIYHTRIYEYMLKYPGIAEVHDYVLQPFFYYSYMAKGEKEKFLQALESGYGLAGREYFEKVSKREIRTDDDMDIERFPMSHTVWANAKATIYHNHWSRDKMRTTERVYVIPHASFDKKGVPEDKKYLVREEFKQKYGIKDEIIVGCFGFVNENKRPDKILYAVSALINEGYKIKLIYFGKNNMNLLTDIVAQQNMGQNVIITGYLNSEQYEVGLEMTDIVINLRYPSMGEASGTLCEAFQYGKPVLVSHVNQYTEYPDEVCWKVPVGKYEIPIIQGMIAYLIDHVEVKRALGNNAKSYAESALSCDKIARMYYNVIESVNKEDD